MRKPLFCLFKIGKANIYLNENATDNIFKCDSTNYPSNLLNLIPSPAFSIPISLSSNLAVFFPIQFSACQSLARSPVLCCLPSCPLETVCYRFPSFFPASAYKPGTLPPPSRRSRIWRESAKGVITMSIRKHHTLRDCMDESTDGTGKLPTQSGTSHLLHSGAPQHSTPAQTHEVQTRSRKIRTSGAQKKNGGGHLRGREVLPDMRCVYVQVCECVSARLYMCSGLSGCNAAGENCHFSHRWRKTHQGRERLRGQRTAGICASSAHTFSTYVHGTHPRKKRAISYCMFESIRWPELKWLQIPPGKCHTVRYNLFVWGPAA